MEKQYRYLVKWERIMPTLVRLDPEDGMKASGLEKFESSRDLCWVYRPELDGIAEHPEHVPEYTEITADEAAEVKRQKQAENDRTEKELTVTCVSRSRRKTEDGPAEVVTYSKASKLRSFSLDEYVEILWGYLAKKRTVFRRIDYSWYDEWGYPKARSITRKADIPLLIGDQPQEVEARFSDAENNYVLRAPFLFHTIELEAVPKKK